MGAREKRLAILSCVDVMGDRCLKEGTQRTVWYGKEMTTCSAVLARWSTNGKFRDSGKSFNPRRLFSSHLVSATVFCVASEKAAGREESLLST